MSKEQVKVQAEEHQTPHIPGVFAIDKPYNMSSAHAVAIVKWWARRILGEKKVKVGHGGTLDPLATGVLVIAVGREYTRDIEQYVSASKEYRATVRLGMTSNTDDEEGEKIKKSKHVPSQEEVKKACKQFIGNITQIPPIFSAIKKDGVPAYKKARRGETVIMAPRTVQIDDISIESYKYPDIALTIKCGKGTYIRSLARDIGEALGTGAYLANLSRTRVGTFSLDDAYDVVLFEEK